jgi:hypothetical protein
MVAHGMFHVFIELGSQQPFKVIGRYFLEQHPLLETLKLKSSGKGADLTLDSVCAQHGLPKIILRLLRNPAFGAAAKRC